MKPKDASPRQAPYLVLSGFCMGTADVVPGVSGGTMAVIMGIYSELLAAISSINARFLRELARLQVKSSLGLLHWRFLVSLVTGVGLGVGFMVKIVRLPELLNSKPQPVYAVFFGLVAASAIVLLRKLPGLTKARVASFVGGAAAGFLVVNLVPVSTPEHPFFVFLCGMASICAMLLPGISGSFMLLILGKYEYILGAVSHLDILALLPFAFGALIGITGFARILDWLLRRFPHAMLAMLAGLLVGSLWRIWPYQQLDKMAVHGKMKVVAATPFLPSAPEWTIIGLAVIGFAAVLAIEWAATRKSGASESPLSPPPRGL